jgi:hypothetical protein
MSWMPVWLALHSIRYYVSIPKPFEEDEALREKIEAWKHVLAQGTACGWSYEELDIAKEELERLKRRLKSIAN